VLGGDPVVWLIYTLYLLPALLVAIPAHEMGHALAAYWMGDRSVLAFGYLRPQVRRYIEPYGVVAVVLANTGWGRPAPVQSGRIGYGRQRALYAVAGPAANLALAILFGLILRVFTAAGVVPRPTSTNPVSLLAWLDYALFFLNLSIFAFQLLPIPGLDGWEIVAAFLRRRNPQFFMRAELNRTTVWVVCALIVFFGPILLRFDVLGAVVGIFFQPVSTLILGACGNYISLHPCPLSGGF